MLTVESAMPVFQDVLQLIFSETDPERLQKHLAEFDASVVQGNETRKRDQQPPQGTYGEARIKGET